MSTAPLPAPRVGSPLGRAAIPQGGRFRGREVYVDSQYFPQDVIHLHGPSWLLAFLAIEIAFQLIIITPWGDQARVVVRVGSFAASFLLLFLLRRSRVAHPAWVIAMLIVGIIGLGLLHPDTNGVLAGVATAFLYLGVLAPIFWVPRLRIDARLIRNVFVVMWLFDTASAVFGVLQVYYPGHFQPAASSVFTDQGLRALSIQLADGAAVLRPMGLTASPGGAAIGGMHSVVLGAALLLDRPRPWLAAIVVAGMGCGVFALCLCQVRSFVVMTGVSVVAFGLPFALQGRAGRFLGVMAGISAVAVVAFLAAVAVGGEGVTNRLGTLIEGDPATVYDNTRGLFLKETFTTLLPEYPLGAGLGRWGVIQPYFGADLRSKPLWAEIQWTAWLYDGGFAMILANVAAFLVALRVALYVAMRSVTASDRELQKWATAVFGLSMGTIALTFCGIPMCSNLGIDFWLFNALVFAASHQASAMQAGAAPG